MKVVELKTGKDLIVEDVISTLENLLEQAKEGRIAAICVGYVRPSGAVNSIHSGTDDVGALLGAVTLAQVRLASDCEED